MSEFQVGATFNIETPERFPQLPALAERLGVKPNEGDSGFFLCMKDGTRYDAFALINAVLDRLDVLNPPPDDAQTQQSLGQDHVNRGHGAKPGEKTDYLSDIPLQR